MENNDLAMPQAARAVVPDGIEPLRVSPVPASIPIATEIIGALSWCIEQAGSIMQISAGSASTHGDESGALEMINSMASDIAINLEMAAQAIETRSAVTAGHSPKGESAVAKPCAQGEPSC